MKQKLLGTALASLLLAAPLAHSAEFICQDDVKPASYSPEEQRLVDQFWEESLTYLGQYLRVLETPTGECPDSAEATIQTYDAAAGAKQTRCIMRYRDIELLAKHLRAVQAEPDKAKKCFDPQKNYGAFPLYTPSAEVQALSAVCRSRAATRPWTACTAC